MNNTTTVTLDVAFIDIYTYLVDEPKYHRNLEIGFKATIKTDSHHHFKIRAGLGFGKIHMYEITEYTPYPNHSYTKLFPVDPDMLNIMSGIFRLIEQCFHDISLDILGDIVEKPLVTTPTDEAFGGRHYSINLNELETPHPKPKEEVAKTFVDHYPDIDLCIVDDSNAAIFHGTGREANRVAISPSGYFKLMTPPMEPIC